MAPFQPDFAIAYKEEERDARNRFFKKLTHGMSLETYIGEDLRKQIPGLYCLTMMPESLAARHGVPLQAIEAIALEHSEPAPGQHLFRFYDHPEDWQTTDKIARFCAAQPGMFDIQRVYALAQGEMNSLGVDLFLESIRRLP